MKSVFIFRRDFRIIDNLGFLKCYEESDEVLPIFIFTPEQANPNQNQYFSSKCFTFLVDGLKDLDKYLKKLKTRLYIFYDDNVDCLKKIKREYDYDRIYTNIDYTPYAKKRDKDINEYCEENNIELVGVEDYLLYPMGTIKKNDGGVYQKYTPFKNTAIKMTPEKPSSKKKFNASKFVKKSISHTIDWDRVSNQMEEIDILAQRDVALNILKKANTFAAYKEYRNQLTYQTTHLSPYIKYGLVSIREVYWAFREKVGLNNGIIEQLLWREFYFYIINYQPEILTKGQPQHMKFGYIPWKNNRNWFEKWKEGRTGYPVVDAGIREMNETGYMHNRARLIVASILIKVLQIDWRWGEKYFSQKLIDYDPSVNNGNWQWCAGTGENPQDYWRFFSPWKQAMDYDPQCEYIKRWVPELENIPNEIVLKWNEKYEEYKNQTTYPKPIVEFDSELRDSTLEMYRESFKTFDDKKN